MPLNGPAACVVVAGAAGSGKTTLGRTLARRMRAVPLDLDVLTNPLLDGLGNLLADGHWLAGPQAAQVRTARYATLLAVARDVLGSGLPVVLMAPFTAELRGGPEWERLRAAVEPHDLVVLHLDGPPAVLAERRAARGEPRDGFRPDVAPERPRVPHTTIDVLLDPQEQVVRGLQAVGADVGHPVLDRSFDAVLFDLDGTLLDSTPAVLRSWARLAGEFGFPADAVQRNHGRPAEALLSEFLDPADVVRAVARVETFETEDVGGVVALPGARALLDSLPVGRWAIVTSGTAPVAGARLAAAGLEPPAVFVSRDQVTRPKPDPQPFLLAARRLGVDPARCLVVEDAPAGVRSGKAAGCAVVAVAGTVGPEELLGADLVVDSLDLLHAARADAGIRITRRH